MAARRAPTLAILLLCAGPAQARTVIPAASADWILDGGAADAILGSEASRAGDVNGDGFDDLLITESGRILLYPGSSAGLSSVPAWAFGPAAAASFYLGFPAGDVNGDGFDDVLIGDPGNDDPLHDEGRALLFLGSAAGLSVTPAWIVKGDQPGQTLGWNVGGGDVDGDGYSDLVVLTGDRVQVFAGSAAGPPPAASWTTSPVTKPAIFLGNRAAELAIQDLNGDGFADLVTTTLEPRSTSYLGRLLVFEGSPSGLIPSREINLDLGKGTWIAVAAPAGDLDGDQRDDVAVSFFSGPAAIPEPGFDEPNRVMIYSGGRTGLKPRARVLIDGIPSQSLVQAGGAGDLNGDGYGDFFVAEDYSPLAGGSTRSVKLFHGSARGPDAAPAVLIQPEQGGDNFPFWAAVGRAGDVNGDGYADFLVCAPRYDGSLTDQGRAYLFHGGPGL